MASSVITRDMAMQSRIFLDKFSAWFHESVSKGKHGDMIRTAAGGRSAAAQYAHTTEFGLSADPRNLVNKAENLKQEAHKSDSAKL